MESGKGFGHGFERIDFGPDGIQPSRAWANTVPSLSETCMVKGAHDIYECLEPTGDEDCGWFQTVLAPDSAKMRQREPDDAPNVIKMDSGRG